MWRKDGKELYFVTDDFTIMAACLTPGPASLQPTPAVRLFQTQFPTFDRVQYASTADGQRFLVNLPLPDDRPEDIHIIHSWKRPNASLTSRRR